MVWTLEEAFPMFSFPSAPRKQEVASLTPLKIVKKKKKKISETDGTGRDDYQIKPRMSIKAAAGFHFHLKIGVLLPDGWLAGWLAVVSACHSLLGSKNFLSTTHGIGKEIKIEVPEGGPS